MKLEAFQEIHVVSSLDGSSEPSLLWLPDQAPEALVVGLHTWSFDRFNQQERMMPYCRERNWALLLPEFRGPNLVSNPRAMEAGGSALARRDIVDATRCVLAELGGELPTLLLGGSGGGHMALMTAAREGFPWTAVSSWCPVSDLVAFHGANESYRAHVEAVCGGNPRECPRALAEAGDRSPLNWAAALSGFHLEICHGRYDRAVSYRQSWELARELEASGAEFFFHLFDGGHELRLPNAFQFFDRTLADRSGTSVDLTG